MPDLSMSALAKKAVSVDRLTRIARLMARAAMSFRLISRQSGCTIMPGASEGTASLPPPPQPAPDSEPGQRTRLDSAIRTRPCRTPAGDASRPRHSHGCRGHGARCATHACSAHPSCRGRRRGTPLLSARVTRRATGRVSGTLPRRGHHRDRRRNTQAAPKSRSGRA
eukprot:scaffold7210_cov32-Tisochrysis_lutea.AAC.6